MPFDIHRIIRSWVQPLLGLLLLFSGAGTIANPALSGTWSGQAAGTPMVVVFDGNGGGLVNGRKMSYQTLGSLLLVEEGGQIASYSFEIAGNRLTVSGGQFPGPVVFSRGTAAAGAAQAKRTPQNPGTGTRADLVGKWCKVTNFSANGGGGSQSSACFELRADGSYIYGSESSMSAQSAGMWGGTSSASSDAGRWSASDRSLTAHSQSGRVQTYPLEKRNHPRNRDPMLCLDGECYVTFWQKPPW